MKKTISSILISFLMISCSSDIPSPTEEKSATTRRTQEEIVLVAQQIAETFEDSPARSRQRSVSSTALAIPLHANAISRSSCSEPEIYAVNYENEEGYALVLSNKDLDGTLAFIPEGSFTESSLEDNPALNHYLTCIEDALKEYSEMSDDAEQNSLSVGKRKIYDVISDKILEEVSPRIQMKLGQRYPEGMYFENGCSGCAQTAAAMAMSYFEEPKTLTLTYPGHTINTLSLNWTEIKKHTGKDSTISTIGNNCPASVNAHESISHLCREIGHLAGARTSQRDSSKTTTDLNRIPPAISKILKSKTVSSWESYSMNNSSDESSVIDLIKSNAIIYMTGQTYDSDNRKVGHGWIIDGFKHIKRRIETLSSEEGSHEFDVINIREEFNRYYHFNWGWNGKDNGYFKFDNWHTRKADSYTDTGRTKNKINFNLENEYIYIK